MIDKLIEKFSVEGMLGAGLIIVSIVCIYVGDDKLANDIVIGLIGYMSRQAVTKKGDKE